MDSPLRDQDIPQAFSSMNPALLSSPGNGLIQDQNMALSQGDDATVPAYPPRGYDAYPQVDPQLLSPPDSALQHVESPASFPVVQGHPDHPTNPHTSIEKFNHPPPQAPPSTLDSTHKRYQLDKPPSLAYTEQHYEPSYHLHRHKPVKVKHYQEKPQIQVVSQASDSKSQVADSMQMMMMNQMMMQQMQAQQIQAAQMAAMNQQNLQMQSQMVQSASQGSKGHKQDRSCKQSQGAINIQSCSQKVKTKHHGPRARHAIKPKMMTQLPPPSIAMPAQQSAIDTVAMDNWQEATIILCFAAVGLIYLVCSRAGGEGKKEDLARKHMS